MLFTPKAFQGSEKSTVDLFLLIDIKGLKNVHRHLSESSLNWLCHHEFEWQPHSIGSMIIDHSIGSVIMSLSGNHTQLAL